MAQQGVQVTVTVPCGHSYCIPRPVLKKNTMLAEVVEGMKKTGLQDVPPDHCYTGPGDVACDVTGRRLKAVKTCLRCLVCVCLQPHHQSPAFKKHKLVKASSELQENICSRHDEVEKVFCRTDKQCICSLCSVEEHKGHDTTSAAAERTERQKELDTSQQNIQQRIQEREKDVKVLHQEVESINHGYFEDVTVAVSKMRDKLEDIRTEEGTNVSETVNRADVLQSTPPEPKTRAEFSQYSRPITLDPNTANQFLSLSEGNRKVTRMDKHQSNPDHPERFTGLWAYQVLSKEGLTGRCYWEVESSGGRVDIAVSYKDISRTGGECLFGSNDISWSLHTNGAKNGYFFIHSDILTSFPGPVSSRVGVYLDHSAGTLSFYSVSDTMTLLHTVHTMFTHNLHAGLNLYSEGVTAELFDFK